MFSRRDFLASASALAGSLTLPASGQPAPADVSISAADSSLKNALDVYFDFLMQLVEQRGFGGTQKLLVCNTVTSFDIAADTPYYDQGLFRNFADRTLAGSPAKIGPANSADRFSFHYERLIDIANSKIDQNHPEIQNAITPLEGDLTVANKRLADKLVEVAGLWNNVMTQKGIKKGDSDYALQYLSFLSDIKYADQIKVLERDVNDTLRKIDAVRRTSYTQWEQTVLDNFDALDETTKEARPLQPTLERSIKAAGGPLLTDLSFANPDYRSPSIFDISPSIYPLGDLNAFLSNTGTRSFTVTKSSQSHYTHDSQWGAGGSASFSIFGISVGGGGGGGGSGSSHFAQDIHQLNTISCSYQNIDEVLTNRGNWFNPGVFEDPHVLKLIGSLPEIKRLQYVAASLIVARGLTLTLSFDTTVDSNVWSNSSINASGGISLFGYSFGGSGSGSSTTTTITVSGDQKTVTFKDDPALCRLLAYRVEPFVDQNATMSLIANATDAERKHLFNDALVQFKKGKMSYIDLQKVRLDQ